MISARQSSLDELCPYRPSLDQFQRAEERRRQAIDLVRSHFRYIVQKDRYEVYSFTKPGAIYRFYLHKDESVRCHCPGFIARGDCRHASCFRLAKGLVKVLDIYPGPWKRGHLVLLEWMDWFDLDENNPATSREILNLILNDGTMTKVQTVRSRISELENNLFTPLISHYGRKKPYYFFINREGVRFLEHQR